MLYFIAAAVCSTEFEWLERQDGLTDRAQFDAYAAAVPVIVDTPREREMWTGSKVLYLPSFAV